MAPAARAPDPHAPANQSPPFVDVNLFASDRPLRDAVARHGVEAGPAALFGHGAWAGSRATLELGRLANENPPRLRTYDERGARLDVVEFHPAWHELMRAGMAAGLHDPASPRVARAARLFMTYQAEPGHVCPLTMTHAAAAALAREPEIARDWAPRIAGRRYDPSFAPWWEKSAVTLGMGMTEKQGGTDVRANVTRAMRSGDAYEISGHKWFMSAPMSDAFLVLAQAEGGLTCFLVPRFRPDGSVNGLRFLRLKDKLGDRANASSEAEFEAAFAQRIGEEGAGVRTIIGMVGETRLDCVIASAGLMRFALAQAMHHARHRAVFGRALSEQPLMRAVLAELALESEAATALAIRLSAAFDRPGDEAERAYARLLTPVLKYSVCKTAPGFVYEAMECLGGNGFVEEWPLARAYRQAPVNAIWEGSGNVMALDVLRVANRQPELVAQTVRALAKGGDADDDADADEVLDLLRSPEATAFARAICERLACLAAAAALRDAHPWLAQAWRSARRGGTRSGWGASDLRPWSADLIARVLP